MGEQDYESLRRLEDAFERKDVSYFVSFLKESGTLPLLLRVHSVCMLEHIGDESVVPELCRILNEDSSPLTRHEAAFTLGQLGYNSAVPMLVEAMLKDPSPIVRHESAVALSSLGDVTVMPQLEKAIADHDEDVANSALIAFEYLGYLRGTREKDSKVTGPKIRL